jgi:hypothetical protein
MRSLLGALAVAAALAAGCGPVRLLPALSSPVLAPAEVIDAHNAWADSIQHLWSRTHLKLSLPHDEEGAKPLQFDLDGHVFFEKPDCLFVHGDVLGQELIRVGMNSSRFWLWVRPRVNTVWVGKRGGAGEGALGLMPTDLLPALGIFRITLSPGQPAGFEAWPHAYVLTESRRVDGRVVPARRIWFDRRTLRPVRVDVFGESGRQRLMAELLAYEKMGNIDVCTVYRARFYGDEDELDLVLTLTDGRLDKPIRPEVFEYRLPPGAKEENLDAGGKFEAPKKRGP